MPRTKKPGPRDSSLLPGTTVSPDSIRYLELMVDELQCTMDNSVATARAIANRICSQVDIWYNNLIRTVPEEILNKPYMELRDSGYLFPMPDTTALSTFSATSSNAQTSAESTSSASMQTRLKKLAASGKAKRAPSQHGSVARGKKKASDEPVGSKPKKMQRKASMHTPVRTRHTAGKLPVVTPKFDIRKRPATARKARKGETLLSLSGSPVDSQLVEAIHIHMANGKVKLTPAASSSSVQELCKAIQGLCEK
uniref:Borealin C-terminal domain-containing protein n=1 Tax=Amblyomma parvum TaxID=251391 RepID=A0A023FSP3_AMBPA